MTRRMTLRIFAPALAMIASCSSPPEVLPASPAASASVWAIDLVRTLPSAQAHYLRSIETNWAGARRIALMQGAVISYRALVTPQDSLRAWDVMLMTEYADSSAWARREEIFQAIFSSPEFVAVAPARPSAEMREFVAGDAPMRAFVARSPRDSH